MNTAFHPIRNLQTMLRSICKAEGYPESVIPDGIYGRATTAAVAAFQKAHALPVTGIADRETWEEIVQCYDADMVELQPAQAIQTDLPADVPLTRGCRHHCLFLAQCMLREIADHYHCTCAPEINGVLDDATISALEGFQKTCALPATGSLDKQTWKQLALHYPAAANFEKNMSGLLIPKEKP